MHEARPDAFRRAGAAKREEKHHNTAGWAKIERAAREILEVRQRYPQSSLADLYDEIAMPYDLRQAHRANDAAVMRAYGFEVSLSESECVKAAAGTV